jgi:hypothetical protein
LWCEDIPMAYYALTDQIVAEYCICIEFGSSRRKGEYLIVRCDPTRRENALPETNKLPSFDIWGLKGHSATHRAKQHYLSLDGRLPDKALRESREIPRPLDPQGQVKRAVSEAPNDPNLWAWVPLTPWPSARPITRKCHPLARTGEAFPSEAYLREGSGLNFTMVPANVSQSLSYWWEVGGERVGDVTPCAGGLAVDYDERCGWVIV